MGEDGAKRAAPPLPGAHPLRDQGLPGDTNTNHMAGYFQTKPVTIQ